jgi:hypothetical protein
VRNLRAGQTLRLQHGEAFAHQFTLGQAKASGFEQAQLFATGGDDISPVEFFELAKAKEHPLGHE